MLHVVGLPHTNTTDDYCWCAYTGKVKRFGDMMSGHNEVTIYGGPENSARCLEHVTCIHSLPANGVIPDFDANAFHFKRFNAQAIRELRDRLEPRDLICLIAGRAQQPIADAFPAHQVVEFGIGYGGIIPTTHHVYESYAWMHTVLGSFTGGDAHRADGKFFDTVIPNYYEPADFPMGEHDGDYLLFVGRLIERKGVQVAIDTAKALGMRLKIAGAGDTALIEDDCVEYMGVVQPAERAALMGGARAILVPTLYVEPFGGVAVEAQLCGTPAITTDFGAFTETIEDGQTGFRCHTMAEFISAVELADTLDHTYIRSQALKRFSLAAVGPQYERYFDRLSTLWGDGFYQLSPQFTTAPSE